MRVLYLQHSGTFGGSAKSLLEMITAFPDGVVESYVICQAGPAADALEKAGCPVIRTIGLSIFDHSRLGYYRGWRWLILLREIFLIPLTFWAVFKARRQWKSFDLIHANEYYMVWPVMLCRLFFRCPVVEHARSLQENHRGTWRIAFYKWFVHRFVDKVIAIDRDVWESQLAVSDVRIVYNGINLDKMTFLEEKSAGWPKQKAFTVGFVGIFHAYKGIIDLLLCAEICQKKGLDINFVLCGDVSKSHQTIKLGRQTLSGELERIIREKGLRRVSITPFEPDLRKIYSHIDVVCFPSHLEAVGRPVFEAGFFCKPSIVALSHDSQEVFIHGVTGVRVPPKNPAALAQAVEMLYFDREQCQRLGNAARKISEERFNIVKNVQQVLDCYRELLVK